MIDSHTKTHTEGSAKTFRLIEADRRPRLSSSRREFSSPCANSFLVCQGGFVLSGKYGVHRQSLLFRGEPQAE